MNEDTKVMLMAFVILLVCLASFNFGDFTERKEIICYDCIMLMCYDENGERISNQGCFIDKGVAEETYHHYQYSTGCSFTSIDYDFLDGEKLCYDENGAFIK